MLCNLFDHHLSYLSLAWRRELVYTLHAQLSLSTLSLIWTFYPDTLVFGRDLLQVEIQNRSRSKTLFTLFNNHLKSHYVDFRTNPAIAKQRNDARRTRQAEVVAEIVKAETRPDSRFIILGDMNDPPPILVACIHLLEIPY